MIASADVDGMDQAEVSNYVDNELLPLLSFSTSSGLAPTSVVTTITYGRFIAGSRSVVILVSETTPKTITSTTATNTVYGRFTLYFGIILVPPEKLYV